MEWINLLNEASYTWSNLIKASLKFHDKLHKDSRKFDHLYMLTNVLNTLAL